MTGSTSGPVFIVDVNIRTIERTDLATLLEMLQEFAEFEDLLPNFEVTQERLSRAMFGEDGPLEGLIAFVEEKSAGYALFFPNFSSFRGQCGFYLDDLYIRSQYRGMGLGERMLKEIARIAHTRGYERIDFVVLDWNTPAIGFYEKLGYELFGTLEGYPPESRQYFFAKRLTPSLPEGTI